MLSVRDTLTDEQKAILDSLAVDLGVSSENHKILRDYVHSIKDSLYYIEMLAGLLDQGAEIPKRERAVEKLRSVADCLERVSLPALVAIENARDAMGEALKKSSVGPDGIYAGDTVNVFKHVGRPVAADQPAPAADANIFKWYEDRLPVDLSGSHVLDWGAGIGRFTHFLMKRKPSHISLVEPSDAQAVTLRQSFGGSEYSCVSVEHAAIGATVPRYVEPARTFNVCTFVVSCFAELAQAYRELEASVRSGELLYIATNVFVPRELAAQVPLSDPFSMLQFAIKDFAGAGVVPRSRIFHNQIIETKAILKDSVHTLYQHANLVAGSQWEVVESTLTPPCGFQHVIVDGDDFAGLEFRVLLLILRRL
jgi:hypothetical protein